MMYRSFGGYGGFGGCLGFGDRFYGGSFFPMLMVIILTAVVVAIIVFAVKKINSSTKRNTEGAALEELKIKFAKGEIGEDEYLRRKRILSE